jgi:uncharacterized glyoxalase superfamily protein PhnB
MEILTQPVHPGPDPGIQIFLLSIPDLIRDPGGGKSLIISLCRRERREKVNGYRPLEAGLYRYGQQVYIRSNLPFWSAANTPKDENLFLSPTLQTESKGEADRIFKALSAGGVVQMPMADMPWGDYYGNFKDKFGVQWMLSYTYPKAK